MTSDQEKKPAHRMRWPKLREDASQDSAGGTLLRANTDATNKNILADRHR